MDRYLGVHAWTAADGERWMNKWLKRGTDVVLFVPHGLAGLAGLGLYRGKQRAERRIDITVAPVTWVSDAAAMERGRYLYGSPGRVDCHA